MFGTALERVCVKEGIGVITTPSAVSHFIRDSEKCNMMLERRAEGNNPPKECLSLGIERADKNKFIYRIITFITG